MMMSCSGPAPARRWRARCASAMPARTPPQLPFGVMVLAAGSRSHALPDATTDREGSLCHRPGSSFHSSLCSCIWKRTGLRCTRAMPARTPPQLPFGVMELAAGSRSHALPAATADREWSLYHRPGSSFHSSLCSCIWKRTGRRSATIQSARSRGDRSVLLGENSTSQVSFNRCCATIPRAHS